MFEGVSNDIKIVVTTRFEKIVVLKYKKQYVFSYDIRITNLGIHKVQLINRKWIILNARSEKKIVQGPGVVGKQPILLPGDEFNYSSWCPLNTELGKMYGHFEMLRVDDNTMFNANVPVFQFRTDFVLN